MKNIILVITCILLMMACSSNDTKKDERIRFVKTSIVTKQSLDEIKVFPGVLKEKREVKVSFRISGPLVKFPVKQGQYVKKGDLIAKIDDRDYKIKVASTKAQWEQAKAAHKRFKALYKKKSISKSTLEQVTTKYELAKAQHTAAVNALGDTKLTAPFSGYIQMKLVENFEKVRAGYPLVTLIDVSSMEVAVDFPEQYMLYQDKIKSYTCAFAKLENKRVDAKFISMEKKADYTTLYKVRLKITPLKDIKMVPGMEVNVIVDFHKDNKNEILVPLTSIFHDGENKCIWVLDKKSSKVHKRVVSLGDINSSGLIEVVAGLKDGERIIVAGANSLVEDQKVKILLPKSKTNIGGQL